MALVMNDLFQSLLLLIFFISCVVSSSLSSWDISNLCPLVNQTPTPKLSSKVTLSFFFSVTFSRKSLPQWTISWPPLAAKASRSSSSPFVSKLSPFSSDIGFEGGWKALACVNKMTIFLYFIIKFLLWMTQKLPWAWFFRCLWPARGFARSGHDWPCWPQCRCHSGQRCFLQRGHFVGQDTSWCVP